MPLFISSPHPNKATNFRLVFYLLFFLVVCVYFLWLNNSPFFPDPDSFYHAKIIELIRDSGPVISFPWLPFTTLGEIFIDHHFLYHLAVLPLTYFLPSLLAVKLAAVIFAALAIILFQWLLDKLQVRYSWLFTFVLLFSDQFIFRLNLAKAPSLSLIFILLAIYFLSLSSRRWSWPLFILSFFYVWLYGGWPILLGMGVIYFIITGVGEHLEDAKKQAISNIGQRLKLFFSKLFSWPNLRLPLSIFSGLLAGLIINPYFPTNLRFYWQQTFEIGLKNYRGLVDVGGEWYPPDFFALVSHNIYSLILFLLALVIFFVFLRRQRPLTWLALFLSLFFFFLTLKSQRNIEYAIPFILLFSALSFSSWLGSAPHPRQLFLSYRPPAIVIIICLIVCLPIIFSYNFWGLRQSLRGGFSWHKLEVSCEWLKKNTPPQTLIFHDNWADFPLLFYRNTEARYLLGLDPTFMYFENQEKYFFWRDASAGRLPGPLCSTIKNNFQADYIFITQLNRALDPHLASDPGCVKVYEDTEARIYRIN